MGKSKYPSKQDTSVEIPAVRDNILEVGSEVINSLRSAIFQIERTLGINPQGASGNTVADRLNKSLDGNGNIKKEALDQANILSGPITDSDVSKVAAIQETKLKLNYPTNLLQSEISVLGNQLDSLIEQLEEVNSILTTHVHPSAKNRHNATSISTTTQDSSSSSTATLSIEDSNVQDVLSSIYNKHINYDGADISLTNRSHESKQIFFDDENVSSIVAADNAQDAIEGAILSSTKTQILHQDAFHSNGYSRRAKADTPSEEGLGPVIAEEVEISFSNNNGDAEASFTINFTEPFSEESLTVDVSDLVVVEDTSNEDSSINGSYQISSVTRNADDDVTSVVVFGSISENSNGNTIGTVRKRLRRDRNQAGLLVTARQDSVLSSSDIIQICSPNSVRLISDGIRPKEITSSNQNIKFNFNSEEFEVDVYDSSVSRQTIDSILSKINEKIAEEAWPFSAYRLDKESGHSEIVVAYNYEDDESNAYIAKVSRGTDDAIDAFGFAHLEGQDVVAEYGSTYTILGTEYDGILTKLNSTELVFFEGLRTVDIGNSSIDFEELGLRPGDIINISGAASSSDNGSFVIKSVSSTTLRLDDGQLPSGFSAASGEDAEFIVYNNIVNLSNINFKEVSGGFSSALVEIFMDTNREVFAHTIIEYAVTLNGSNPLFEIVGYSGTLLDGTHTIDIENGTDGVLVSLDSGEQVNFLGKNSYVTVCSGSSNISLTLLIDDADEVNSYISLNADISTEVYTFNEVSSEENLVLANIPFGSYTGKVIGGEEGNGRIFSVLENGNIGFNEIGTSARKSLTEIPISELRSNGVVKNLNISSVGLSDGLYTFTLSDGIFYVGGKRYEYSGQTYLTDIVAASSDKIYIYADLFGNIKFEEALSSPTCANPADDSEVVMLHTLEYNGSTVISYDLRLFITDLDLKVLNSITVSPQKNMGHFSSLKKAIDYARRFSQIFPNAGTPMVHLKSGTFNITVDHDVGGRSQLTYLTDWGLEADTLRADYYDALYDAGLLIDFPLVISGEGDSTVLNIRDRYNFTDGTQTARGNIVFVGSGFARTTRPVVPPTSGFTCIKDLKLNQCRISVFDYNIYDGSSDPQFYGVDIVNLTIDHNADTGASIDTAYKRTGILIGEESDETNEKGNVTISGCKFLRARIKTGSVESTSVDRINNINVFGCSMYGEFDDGLSFGDIFSLASIDRPEQHNINYIGNQHFSNQNTIASGNGPDMIDGSSAERWGERFSRDINVGADAYVKGTVDADVSVKTESFIYKSTKTLKQVYTFEGLDSVAVGPTNSGLSVSTISDLVTSNGPVWRVINIVAAADEAYIRINPPDGATIDDIICGVSRGATSSNHFDWTMTLHEVPLNGSADSTVSGPTTVTSVEQATGEPHFATFSNVNYTVDSENNTYWVELGHDQGTTEQWFFVKVTYNFTVLEKALGV